MQADGHVIHREPTKPYCPRGRLFLWTFFQREEKQRPRSQDRKRPLLLNEGPFLGSGKGILERRAHDPNLGFSLLRISSLDRRARPDLNDESSLPFLHLGCTPFTRGLSSLREPYCSGKTGRSPSRTDEVGQDCADRAPVA